MKMSNVARAALAALIGAALAGAAHAEIKSYEFQLLQPTIKVGADRIVTVRLVEKTSGNPLYDQAALRAITEATPFPPLPEEFRETFLRIHLGFNYSGTRG